MSQNSVVITKEVCKHKAFLIFLVSISFLMLHSKSSPASEDPSKDMGITKMKKALAPEFVLPTPDDKLIALTDFRGKVVFINFWASWCKPCRDEMPSMEKLYNSYKDKGLVMLGVNVMEDADTAKGFMDELGLTFMALMDRGGEVKQLYSVYAIPTSYLIDKKGRIKGRAVGARDWSLPAAFSLIEKLLEER